MLHYNIINRVNLRMSKKSENKLKVLSSVLLPYYLSIAFYLYSVAFLSPKHPVLWGVISLAIGPLTQVLSILFFSTDDLKKVDVKYHLGCYVVITCFLLPSLLKMYLLKIYHLICSIFLRTKIIFNYHG